MEVGESFSAAGVGVLNPPKLKVGSAGACAMISFSAGAVAPPKAKTGFGAAAFTAAVELLDAPNFNMAGAPLSLSPPVSAAGAPKLNVVGTEVVMAGADVSFSLARELGTVKINRFAAAASSSLAGALMAPKLNELDVELACVVVDGPFGAPKPKDVDAGVVGDVAGTLGAPNLSGFEVGLSLSPSPIMLEPPNWKGLGAEEFLFSAPKELTGLGANGFACVG